ncbi:MAG: cobalamin transport system ATP-binding protein [Thermosediminibacterales bacterium]|nr:cobalamin transport system ATP-binding protein [Thermosediminibacterales bacterium]MDK2901131.1 cobalamin transport system ATP-binding protein [Thermosediminibacterales bacterium]
MAAILNIDNIVFRYGSHDILKEISLNISKGDFVGILGPNGSGKTTLLKTITRVCRPVKGIILIDNKDIYGYSNKEFAQKIAFVPQDTSINFDFTVEDIILMGRNPYLKPLKRENIEDYRVVMRSMELTDTLKFKDKKITQLSGGEMQRVLIARALAQEPEILILDEPTSHLDINYKFEILELLKIMNMKGNITVIIALHDINLASLYCKKIILLKDGRIFAAGIPEEVVSSKNLEIVFKVKANIYKHPITGKPYATFLYENEIEDLKKISNNRRLKIHVIGGGGQASLLLRDLHKKGYTLTAGVLNIGDSDWKTAKQLKIQVIEESPFAPISYKSYQENIELMKSADLVVLGNIPFGYGNIANLEGLLMVMDCGKKAYIIKGDPVTARDYTGGRGQQIYEGILKKGAILVNDYTELDCYIKEEFFK